MALTLLTKAILLCETAVVVTSQRPSDAELRQMGTLSFQSQDLNGDGSISVKEILEYFDNLDRNKDGVLTLREYSGLPRGTPIPTPVKKRFNFYDKLDGNRDGKVQRSHVESLLRSNDLNGDGRVTLDEIIRFFLQSLGPAMRGRNPPSVNEEE